MKPAKKTSRVRRILVTGFDDQLLTFHVLSGVYVNPIEQRDQTIFFTVISDSWQAMIEAAKTSGVTVQEIVYQAGEETYEKVAGDGEGWKPKPESPTKKPKRTATPGPPEI